MIRSITSFMKKESILCAAMLLAFLSSLIVKPDEKYMNYIDFRVLVLLFCLMAVMAGFQSIGVFNRAAGFMLAKTASFRGLCLTLVFLCFFSAMLVTNDVALITFIPFTIMLFEMAGLEDKLIPVIVLQTIGANLGSMLTPVGNPQNLYLYAVSGMSLSRFISVMFPMTLVSGIMLLLCCLLQKEGRTEVSWQKNIPAVGGEAMEEGGSNPKDKACALYFAGLFVLCLLSVLRVVPYQLLLLVTIVCILIVKRELFAKVDYCLLLTFVSFFIFIGNVGRMKEVSELIKSLLHGRELMAAFLSSQVISNVPAAILLSGFTDHWEKLLLGVNIGGLGTLIASLASLISYKFYAGYKKAKKGNYMIVFTAANVLFAAVLLFLVTLSNP